MPHDWKRIAKPGTICLSEDAYRKGGETVKSLSTAFLADLEEDWRQHGKEIFSVLREKYPQAYFQGIVSLARFIRWDVESTSGFDRTLSPEEIMDKLEERVGPEGRKLFERRHTVSRRPGPSRRPMPASSFRDANVQALGHDPTPSGGARASVCTKAA